MTTPKNPQKYKAHSSTKNKDIATKGLHTQLTLSH